MKTRLLSLVLMLVSFSIAAQNGTIRGTIIDQEFGDPLIGVSVLIESLGTGTSTDIDGNYTIKVPEGNYTLSFSYISFASQKVTDVAVKANQVTIIDLGMAEEVTGLEEIVVTAKASRNTSNALLSMQKKSANLLDGISAQTFSKTGDGDAAAAIKRVPGVSVEGGKHVYVRGLGDRYTKTILNNMEIPGLDPDRNNVQMDIFPTNLLDNIVVYKTFTPDLPGDFTGGMVNITTKDFPERETLSLSTSFGFRVGSSLNNNFVSYKGGKTDWLGFDDGSRALPIAKNTVLPDESLNSQRLSDLTSAFSGTMAIENMKSFIDQSYSLGYGNQYNKEKMDIGFNVALSYKNEFQFSDKYEFNDYRKTSDLSNNQLELSRSSKGSVGINEASWTGLVGTSFKFEKHKFSLTALRTQSAIKKASFLTNIDYIDNPTTLEKSNLEFTERSVTNFGIDGKHRFNKVDVEWRNALTFSSINDPDIRTTSLNVEESDEGEKIYTFRQAEGAQIRRIYRDLKEMNESFRVDVTVPLTVWNEGKSKIKFGLLETYKKRSYENISINFFNNNTDNLTGDPNWYFAEENLWTPETSTVEGSGIGTYALGNQILQDANTFTANQNIAAAYAMQELPITRKFKAIYGLRIEHALYRYTGQNVDGTDVLNNDVVLNELCILPSLNLIYNLVENMNLRASYNSSVARPSFREISYSQIYDPIQNRRYSGNLDLVQSKIHNTDIRWEWFYKPGEMVSVSGFYKKFLNPIEIVAFDEAPDEVQPQNAESANVYGVEFEARKNLKFITDALDGLSIGTNLTYIKSQVQMTEEEIKGRKNFARDGEVITGKREMFGQSPYIVNTYLNYTSPLKRFDANLSYNVQGKRLAVVGIGRLPDVYEQPFHSLNFKMSYKFAKDNKCKLSLAADNILNANKHKQYESFNAENRTYEFWNPGRRFSVGFTYSM